MDGTILNHKSKGGITVRFIDDKRRLSFCTPWLRAVTYSKRDIEKFKDLEDFIRLIVHECCHFIYKGHKKKFWAEQERWITKAYEIIIKEGLTNDCL